MQRCWNVAVLMVAGCVGLAAVANAGDTYTSEDLLSGLASCMLVDEADSSIEEMQQKFYCISSIAYIRGHLEGAVAIQVPNHDETWKKERYALTTLHTEMVVDWLLEMRNEELRWNSLKYKHPSWLVSFAYGSAMAQAK